MSYLTCDTPDGPMGEHTDCTGGEFTSSITEDSFSSTRRVILNGSRCPLVGLVQMWGNSPVGYRLLTSYTGSRKGFQTTLGVPGESRSRGTPVTTLV